MKLIKILSKRYGIYECRCGVVKKFNNYHVKSGASKSCGCYNLQRIKERNRRDHTGKTINKYKILKKVKKGYKMECVTCGNKKTACISATNSCKICAKLNHHKLNDFKNRKFENKIILKNVIKNSKTMWEILNLDTGELDYYNTYRVRRKLIPQVRIAHTIRARLKNILKLKSIKNKDSTAALIGCSFNELVKHLESMFDEKMSWDNYAIYWQIDHIKNLASFDLTDPNQRKEAANYKNLRPLSIKDHRIKSSKETSSLFNNRRRF